MSEALGMSLVPRVGPWERMAGWVDRRFDRLLALPAICVMLLVAGFPLAYTLWMSFHRWYVSSDTRPIFNGTQNYAALAMDAAFWASVLRTVEFTAAALVVESIVGLGLALLLNREFAGRSAARSLLLLPMMATPAAAALIWVMLMNPTLGALNYGLHLLGWPPSLWVSGPRTVIPSLVLVDAWEWSPLIALFCLAGLAVLPAEPLEAAVIDGASRWQQFWFIVLPLLRPTLVVAMLFRAIDALKTFDVIYVMTQGGPGRASETTNLYAFRQAFSYFQMGYAASIVAVFLLLVVVVSGVFVRIRRPA
ncbi:MAG: carbohydrate ABC transporter permease [bacterium]